MAQGVAGRMDIEGWDWLETEDKSDVHSENDQLSNAFSRCFRGPDGAIALLHLRQTFLDRRLGATASDAELRFLEGQRSAVAHIISLTERGRL